MQSDSQSLQTGAALAFESFCLFPAQRRLEKDGQTVKIGSRALDILIALVERAPSVVSKRELLARIWPKAQVEEGNLRFQMTLLRKALGEARAKSGFIRNVSGRGYCFVAPISRLAANNGKFAVGSTANRERELPHLPTLLVGRAESISEIRNVLTSYRFVTIAGPGGIGKTTVAVALSHALYEMFEGSICFLDLGPIADQAFVPAATATALGLIVSAEDPTPGIVAFLKGKRMLLVLDSCEHVIEATAKLARAVFEEAGQVHIIATSREPLRVDGEHLYRLPALDCPPEGHGLTVGEAMSYPAVQLLLGRINVGSNQFALSESDVPYVAEICRRLDGIALAIELAAGRVEAFGVQGIAALLNGQFRLLGYGRRASVARHQTLTAALDWSYYLLSGVERRVLRALSIFVGPFSLEAARSVNEDTDGAETAETVAALIDKSLIAAASEKGATWYRLLDTTRAYVVNKATESGELPLLQAQHAKYYLALLKLVEVRDATLTHEDGIRLYNAHLDNIRSALIWSFSADGDADIGIALAAAASRVFLQLSMLLECRVWAERAISRGGGRDRGRRSLELLTALGTSLMFTRGNTGDARKALEDALATAEAFGDTYAQLQVLASLNMLLHRCGEFQDALAVAERGAKIAKSMDDRAALAVANSLLSVCYHITGSQVRASAHCEAALMVTPSEWRSGREIFGREHRIRPMAVYARSQWLRGFPDGAAETATRTLEEADALGHVPFVCMALAYIIPLYLWMGDWVGAEMGIARMLRLATEHSLIPYKLDALGLRALLRFRQGGTIEAAESLRHAIVERTQARHTGLLDCMLATDLAEALSIIGDCSEAMNQLEVAIGRAGDIGDWFFLPEMLRVKAGILARCGTYSDSDIEALLERSVQAARRILAPAWELRTQTSRARLWRDRGRGVEARDVLEPIYATFSEGLWTADLSAARILLAQLH